MALFSVQRGTITHVRCGAERSGPFLLLKWPQGGAWLLIPSMSLEGVQHSGGTWPVPISSGCAASIQDGMRAELTLATPLPSHLVSQPQQGTAGSWLGIVLATVSSSVPLCSTREDMRSCWCHEFQTTAMGHITAKQCCQHCMLPGWQRAQP